MNSTALYGIAAFADGYAVFWNGRYDETRYATREAAISELAKRDRAETCVNGTQPTPCQQQQSNAGAAHTPGPWHVGVTAGGSAYVANEGGNVVDAGAVSTQDAKLIAVAPDLYDVLATIADAASTVAALESCGERTVLTEIAAIARAALAKVQQ